MLARVMVVAIDIILCRRSALGGDGSDFLRAVRHAHPELLDEYL
jgi:hypothetical protein